MKQRDRLPSSSHNRASPGTSFVKKSPYTDYWHQPFKFAPPTAVLGKLRALKQQSAKMSKKTLFKVVFMCQGQVYEIYARSVSHGELFGFVEVEELL